MRPSLSGIAAANGVPFIGAYDEIGLLPETYTEDKIFGLIEHFAAAYGGELVLYGGQTATERIYGFKRLRDITNDLDYVCTAAGLDRVLREERLFYHPAFDIFFGVRDNVPLSFAATHIHDWPVDGNFFLASTPVRGFSHPVRCCSREHSIMLKLRRMSGRLDRGAAPFGKDALDIINMLVAPRVRADLPPVDCASLAALVRKHVSADAERLDRLIAFIGGYEEHLNDRESPFFREAAAAFAEALKRRMPWKS